MTTSFHPFHARDELFDHAASLLALNLFDVGARHHPTALMLAGGSTPFPVYERISGLHRQAGPGVHILMSDERCVPPDSTESNFGRVRPHLEAWGIPRERIFQVHTGLDPAEAAQHHDRELNAFLDSGGTIALALLGLGADGHTASLFTPEDLRRSRGKYAIQTRDANGHPRVSVTPRLLKKVSRLIFLVVGADKKDIVQRFRHSPSAIVAAQAIRGAARTELWFAN